MCVNCLSNAEVAVANVAITAAFVKGPAHRLLADMGLVEAPDPVKRDVRTVSFLRRLELDPVEVLGRDAVDAADRWVPAEPQPTWLGVRLGLIKA
jgi:hypothetical protein